MNFGHLATQCVTFQLLLASHYANYYYNNDSYNIKSASFSIHSKFMTIRNSYLYTALLAVCFILGFIVVLLENIRMHHYESLIQQATCFIITYALFYIHISCFYIL